MNNPRSEPRASQEMLLQYSYLGSAIQPLGRCDNSLCGNTRPLSNSQPGHCGYRRNTGNAPPPALWMICSPRPAPLPLFQPPRMQLGCKHTYLLSTFIPRPSTSPNRLEHTYEVCSTVKMQETYLLFGNLQHTYEV